MLRQTLKLTIFIQVMFKLFHRSTKQINKPNLVDPTKGLYRPRLPRILNLRFSCTPRSDYDNVLENLNFSGCATCFIRIAMFLLVFVNQCYVVSLCHNLEFKPQSYVNFNAIIRGFKPIPLSYKVSLF